MSEQPKVVKMDTTTKDEKRKTEMDAEELVALAEMEQKFGLTKDLIGIAIKSEEKLSSGQANVKTLIEAMSFYKKEGLSKEQIMFLAVAASNRANYVSEQVEHYKGKFEASMKALEGIMAEKGKELANVAKATKEEE
jgi:hypothetical protein